MNPETFEDYGIEIQGWRLSAGGDHKTFCPECHGTRRNKQDKSLSVNVEKGVWHCHHCEWSGFLRGVDRMESFRPKREYTKPAAAPPAAEEDRLTEATEKFFAERGISKDVVLRRGIWRDEVGLHFPYYRDGEVVNIKTRYHPKRFSMVSGAELCFYGLDDCKDEKTIVIVEGEMDALAIETATGMTNILSVPNGSSGSKNSKLTYVERDADLLSSAHTIILAMDNDEPGKKLENELARIIGREKCMRVHWPEGCKDANDVLVKHGAKGVIKAFEDKVPYPESGIVSVLSFAQDYWDLYHDKAAPGVSTGFGCLDEYYTVKPGELTIVTGQPGCGKSEFLDNIMINLGLRKNDEWRFIVYSPENGSPGDYAGKIAEKFIGKPFGERFKGGATKYDAENALRWLDSHIAFLNPELPTVDELLRLAKAKMLQTGARGLIIDPWNEVMHDIGETRIETNYISEKLSQIKRFALNHGVHVWIVAHPRKMQKEAGEKDYPPATLNDISGSAAWYAKADNGLSVWRSKIPSDEPKPTVIHVQKIRNKRIGKLGFTELDYQWETGRYFDPEETDRGPRKVSEQPDPWENSSFM